MRITIRFFVGGFRLPLVLLLTIAGANLALAQLDLNVPDTVKFGTPVAALAAIPDPGIPDTVKFGTAVVNNVSQDTTVRIRI